MTTSAGRPAPARRETLNVARRLDQPFTIGTLVRAAQAAGVPASDALHWLREAELARVVCDTGVRAHSGNALRGSRLYRLDEG